MLPIAPLLAVTQYLDFLGDLASFSGAIPVVGLLVMVVLMVLIPTWPTSRWVALAVVMLFVTLQRGEQNRYHDLRMSYLVQPLVQLSRPVTVGVLSCMAVGSLFISRGTRQSLYHPATLSFFALQALMCIKLLSCGNYNRGILTIVVFTVTFLSITVGIGVSLQRVEDCKKALWAILGSVIVIVLFTIHELVVRRSGVIINNRMFAVAVNPQTAGTTFALSITLISYLLTGTKGLKSNLAKPFLLVMLGFCTIFLLWTGSRTGLLSVAVGLTVLFYDKVSRLAIIGVLLAGSAYGAFQIFSDSLVHADRLVSTENTRGASWNRMLDTYTDNIVWGTPYFTGSAGESSYLSVLAGMGTVGGVFMLAFLISTTIFLFTLLKNKHLLGEYSRMANLIASGIITILVASILDDYLLGTTAWQTYFLYTYFAIGTFLIEKTKSLNSEANQTVLLYRQKMQGA